MRFSVGESVVHAGRPEWGTGQVTACTPAQHEGKPCQRVTIRFDQVGTKTLSTAFANLKPASNHTPSPAGVTGSTRTRAPARSTATNDHAAGGSPVGWLDELEQKSPAERLTRLPEETRDPFLTFEDRLKNTLNLYRFTTDGASLLAWAGMQTGLRDPLADFSRHELEEHFARFRTALDNHLRQMVRELSRPVPAGVQQILQQAPPEAHPVLRRLGAAR